MKRIAFLLALTLFAALPARAEDKTGPTDTTETRTKVREAVDKHADHQRRCVVSHRMEVAGNAPDQIGDSPDYLELRKGGCPSDDKQKNSTVPAGR